MKTFATSIQRERAGRCCRAKMGNQLAAPARVQPGELLASDVPSLVYKDSLGGASARV